MVYSIYHFFADLCQKRDDFLLGNDLEDFPFDKQMLSCVNKGKFPDLAIRLNSENELGETLSPSMKQELLDIFSEQQTFSKTRDIEKASVKLRFRIMIGVKAGANILNANQYPQIGDNTMNFAVPCHREDEQSEQHDKMKVAFEQVGCSDLFAQMEVFTLQHHFNGKFLVFQANLST